MKIDREVTIRKIIEELNKPVNMANEGLLERVSKYSVRLRQLEEKVEAILATVGEQSETVVFPFTGLSMVQVIQDILGEKENAKESKEKKD